MITKCIPASDVLAAHEQAALEISVLRRKGIRCHLEEHDDDGVYHVDVVWDPAFPQERGLSARQKQGNGVLG